VELPPIIPTETGVAAHNCTVNSTQTWSEAKRTSAGGVDPSSYAAVTA
jgi:hypothetical protein